MNSLTRSKIIDNLHYIADKTINTNHLLNHLAQLGIISENECEEIASKLPSYQQNAALYYVISRKGDQAFDALIECLNNSSNRHISAKLLTHITQQEIEFVQSNHPNIMRGPENDVVDSGQVPMLLEPNNPVSTTTSRANERRLAIVSQQENQQANGFVSEFKNRYGDVEYVGKGGWGVVYKCNPKNSERAVAVKLIENKAQNVAREIAVSLKIHRFENVVKILHHWFEEPKKGYKYPDTTPISASIKNVLFIEMEYCDLGDLRSWFDTHWWDRQHAKTMLYQITKGVDYLHSIEIVHRDLNPQNIMLCSDSHGRYAVAKICDFGVAKQIATKNTTGVGTPGYMAPEVKISGGQYDYKADIYALAITFLDMLVVSHGEYNRLEKEINEAKFNQYGFEFTENIRRIISFEEKAIIEKMVDRDTTIRLSAKDLLEKILPETYNGIAEMKIPYPI